MGREGGARGVFTAKWFPQPEQYSTEASYSELLTIQSSPSQWLLQAASTIQTTSSDFEAKVQSPNADNN